MNRHSLASTILFAVTSGLFTVAHTAEPIVVSPKASPAEFEVRADEVSKGLLKQMCFTAVEKSVHPAKLYWSTGVEATALDESSFSCVVKGKLEDTVENQRRYQRTGDLSRTLVDIEYAVKGNIKTGQMDVARTDSGRAKEVASLVMANMFMNIQAVSVEPKKAVYTAKIIGEKTCTITLAQEGRDGTVRWLASDVQCTKAATKK